MVYTNDMRWLSIKHTTGCQMPHVTCVGTLYSTMHLQIGIGRASA